MVKLSLEKRITLKRTTAESLTDPSFIALSTIDNNGEFISLKTKIKHSGSIPIKVELQYNDKGDVINYHYHQGMDDFYGSISLIEGDEEILTQLSIDKIKHGKETLRAKSTDKGRVGYVNGNGFRSLSKEAVQNVNYWVPTIINHIAKNADRFVTKKTPSTQKIKISTEDSKIIKPRNQYGVNAPLPHSGITRPSTPKSPHFRNSFRRTLEDYEGVLPREINITGFYINTNWQEFTTQEVIDSIKQNAPEIFPLYFDKKLLPKIVKSGHDKNTVLKAFLSRK
tara:strand:+ start:3127 stop:3972 length:846 start_codon:yes stop_codon:yes gene_type:complete